MKTFSMVQERVAAGGHGRAHLVPSPFSAGVRALCGRMIEYGAGATWPPVAKLRAGEVEVCRSCRRSAGDRFRLHRDPSGTVFPGGVL